jgi:hypothetical protein
MCLSTARFRDLHLDRKQWYSHSEQLERNNHGHLEQRNYYLSLRERV